MTTLELFTAGGIWAAKTDCPQTIALFGTDTLPTPFLATTPADEVLAQIEKLNRDKHVFLRAQ